jgi:hypothetical protein
MDKEADLAFDVALGLKVAGLVRIHGVLPF